MRTRRRAGFTVVETTVAMLVGLLFLGLMWTIASRGMRADRDRDERLGGLASILHLRGILEEDLETAWQVEASDGGRVMVVTPADGVRPPVRYTFDAVSGRVARDGRPLKHEPLKMVEFQPVADSGSGARLALKVIRVDRRRADRLDTYRCSLPLPNGIASGEELAWARL